MTPLVQLLIQQSPAIIALVQAAWQKAHPGAPVPTSAEVIAEFDQLFLNSLARDQFLEAALKAEISGQP